MWTSDVCHFQADVVGYEVDMPLPYLTPFHWLAEAEHNPGAYMLKSSKK